MVDGRNRPHIYPIKHLPVRDDDTRPYRIYGFTDKFAFRPLHSPDDCGVWLMRGRGFSDLLEGEGM
jgi:hypothetical protein